MDNDELGKFIARRYCATSAPLNVTDYAMRLIDQGLDEVAARIASIDDDSEFDAIDAFLDEVEGRIASIENTLGRNFEDDL